MNFTITGPGEYRTRAGEKAVVSHNRNFYPLSDSPHIWGGTPHGQVFHDSLVILTKPYCIAIVQEDNDKALSILSDWAKGLSDYIDKTYIDSDPENNRKLLSVFKYYADLFPADWKKLI